MLKLLSSISVFAAILALAAVPAQAQDATPLPPDMASDIPPAYDEKEAQSIDGMLMCPVCAGQTIDQSQATIAGQMRRLVRDRLTQGESRDQILDYFVGVYGQDILAAPGKSGVNLVAWTVPPAGILLALAAGFLVLRAMSVRPSTVNPAEPTGSAGLRLQEETLAPYLEAIDWELALPESRSVTQAPESELEPEPESEKGAKEEHG